MRTKYGKVELSEEYLRALKEEGATDSDIETWWNLTEEERSIIIQDDIQSRLAVFIDASVKGLSAKKAMEEVKRAFPIYDINFYKEPNEDEQSRPFPYELKDRINRHTFKLAEEIGLEKLKKEIRKYPTFNSYMRDLIEKEKLAEIPSESNPQENTAIKKPISSKKKNSLAIISFILSVITPFMGFSLLGIIGFSLGIISLKQIDISNEDGKGLAIAAIVIGSIWGILKLVIDVLLSL